MSRPVLIVMRGLPGSGKTAWARDWQQKLPSRRARVNSAALRRALFMSVQWNENLAMALNSARLAVIGALLRRGISVVCDDTNLRARDVKDMTTVAIRSKALLEVKDFTNVSLETCLAADANRAKPRGADVLRDLHARFIEGQGYPLPLPASMTRDRKPQRPAAPAPLVAAPIESPAPDRAGMVRALGALRPGKGVGRIDTPSSTGGAV